MPVLQLDVRIVAPEDLREAVEVGLGVGRPVLDERLRDPAAETGRRARASPARALEQLPVDARLVVVALEVAERAELDQVPVADVVGGEQRQVRVALVLLAPVVDDVDLAADDRLDALRLRGLEQLDRPGHRAVVGERHGRHLERLPSARATGSCTPRRGSSTRSGRAGGRTGRAREGHRTAAVRRLRIAPKGTSSRPCRRLRGLTPGAGPTVPVLETGLSALDGMPFPADSAVVRHIPISLKLVAVSASSPRRRRRSCSGTRAPREARCRCGARHGRRLARRPRWDRKAANEAGEPSPTAYWSRPRRKEVATMTERASSWPRPARARRLLTVETSLSRRARSLASRIT